MPRSYPLLTTTSNSHKSDWPQEPEWGKGRGSSSDIHWWLNQWWSSGDGKARKPRQMFSQIKWFQEKMKACLMRHLVSINLLSRASAEPSAGIDSLEARSFPHLRVPLHAPSKGLKREKDTGPLDFFQTRGPVKRMVKGHTMRLQSWGRVNRHQGELIQYQVPVTLKETVYKGCGCNWRSMISKWCNWPIQREEKN